MPPRGEAHVVKPTRGKLFSDTIQRGGIKIYALWLLPSYGTL